MPQLSFVVLTLNEERNIRACLDSLRRQEVRDFEVVVVDAASTDGTVAIVRSLQEGFPVPLRLEASARRLPIGEARNLGVAMTRAPVVAFLSADAELAPEWVGEALAALAGSDMAFGLQVHRPHQATLGACVRGLRYHFPPNELEPGQDPTPLASNVAAAYRREVMERHPFDTWANASEDLLLAVRAQRSDFRATYRPRMVVVHHDVATSAQEWRKCVREGEGWALYRRELGTQWLVLAWGAALAVAASSWLRIGPVAALAAAVVLWAPALRRAWRRRAAMPPKDIVRGAAVTPLFDLAYLAMYVRALARRPAAPSGATASQDPL